MLNMRNKGDINWQYNWIYIFINDITQEINKVNQSGSENNEWNIINGYVKY